MDRRTPTNDLATPLVASIPTSSSSSVVRRASRAPGDGSAGIETRGDLAAFLTAGRTARGLTREHVARVTRIQLRTIERLEEGRFDELPADVFVRGFIRNYALCVGLSVDDALARYAACGFAAAPVASPQAQALIDTMAPLAPVAARTSSVVVVPNVRASQRLATVTPPAEVAVVAAPAPAPAPTPIAAPISAIDASASGSMKKVRPGRDSKGRFIRRGTVSQQQAAVDLEALGLSGDYPSGDYYFDDLECEITVVEHDAIALETKVAAPPPAVRSPTTDRIVLTVRPPAVAAAPTLVIDDDDPESAEREREERATREKDKDGGWRSFLPPALLDQDRGRQGGLTLAVIILLIVATLTLSYLMRRPSSTGEGVTAIPAHLDVG